MLDDLIGGIVTALVRLVLTVLEVLWQLCVLVGHVVLTCFRLGRWRELRAETRDWRAGLVGTLVLGGLVALAWATGRW